MVAMKKMTPPTICGIQYQSQKLPACPSTMFTRFMEPAINMTPTTEKPMASS